MIVEEYNLGFNPLVTAAGELFSIASSISIGGMTTSATKQVQKYASQLAITEAYVTQNVQEHATKEYYKARTEVIPWVAGFVIVAAIVIFKTQKMKARIRAERKV